jgi:hypothetical protein
MYFYSKSVAEDRAKALEKEEGDHPKRERGEVFLALERRKRALRIRIAERRESRFIIKRNVLILLLYY